jgi:copper transport protein
VRSIRSNRALVIAVVASALVLATTALALAHATLVSSEPAANSVVSVSPARVRLVFSEQVEPTLAHLSIVSTDGPPMLLVVAGDPHDVNALIAPVSGLHTGSYRLAWRVVSADGHPVDGSFVFSIGAASAVAPPDTGVAAAPTTWGPSLLGAPVLAAALRGSAVGTLAAVGGLLLFLLWSQVDGGPAQRRSTRLANTLSIAPPLLVFLHLTAWILNVTPDHRLTSDAVSAAIASGVGKTELWRLGLTVAA